MEERWGFCAWRERKCGRGMQAQKGEEGGGERETRCWGWKSAIPQSGCRPRILSSSLRATAMFGERANRVLGSVGNRSRFFTAATLFLLSSFAASVWADNSTGSIGECAFFGRPGGILSTPGGGKTTSSFPILHFAHVSFSYIFVYMKISFTSISSPLPSIPTNFGFKKKFSSERVAFVVDKKDCSEIFVSFNRKILVHRISVRFLFPCLSFSRVKSYANLSSPLIKSIKARVKIKFRKMKKKRFETKRNLEIWKIVHLSHRL